MSETARQVTQKSGSRTYVLEDGTELPSVTTILGVIGKPALVNWAASTERALVMDAAADLYQDVAKTPPMSRPTYVSTLDRRIGTVKAHKRENEKATEIGGQAHKLIEWSIRKAMGQTVGAEPRVRDEAMHAYLRFEEWARDHNVTPLMTEQTVWSRTHRYAGTLDLVADVDGVRTLIDFKTSKSIYAEAHLQNVAYQVALAEMGHAPCLAGCIVRVPKNTNDPAFEVQATPSVDELLPIFLSVRVLYDWWAAEDVKSKAAWMAKRNKGAA